jgi:protein involved in polysaccharide export with SLBB domain
LNTLLPKIFGADLFNGTGSTFEPNLRLATPMNYVLGPDDQLNVNVYGNSVDNWKLTVSPEGNINLPHVGFINVSGKTIEQATALIKSGLSAHNYAIGHGADVKVTLGDIRSIKVIITGEITKPGTYTLSSLSTVFNALYASGGPNQNGSFRKIEVIRDNHIIKTLDVYNFLLSGDQSDNISLKDQDIIRVPEYQVRVNVVGEVKRPAIYEVLPGETLQDVFRFCGGFTDIAYTAKIQVEQISDDSRNLLDIAHADFKNYTPQNGDKYIVTRILDRYRNRVSISGAVSRPGNYALDSDLTVSKLIKKASGLRPDAYTQTGTITRTNPDNTTEIISFNVRDVINNPSADVVLKREDAINISSIFDFRDLYTISIKGEVRQPGDFAYADSMTLENLIVKAGGLTDAASPMRIEVSRRINNTNPNSLNGTIAQVYTVNVDNQQGLSATNFQLKPFDIVSVYTSPGYEKQKTVKVEGEVFYPGYYTLRTKNERISDLVAQAGGITPSAYADGSTLKRENSAILGFDKNKVDTSALERERQIRIARIGQSINDSSAIANDQLRNNFVGIDLEQIIKQPGSKTDLILEDGDILRVPKHLQTVTVNGEVLFPSSIVYSSGKSFKNYVLNAGGFSDDALKRKSYILYSNGTVKGTKKFLFFNSYPSVKPGSEIYVPKKPPKRNIAVQEALAITGGLASIGILIIGLINLSK